MKVLYGVQGTGNGHISRARAMADAFTQFPDIDVQWLFSGRSLDDFFEMEDFGQYHWYQGLTFFSSKGKVQNFKTLCNNHPLQFLQDKNHLDVSSYDLVISDYEPVTAWAASKAKAPRLGVGHQYAFNYDIPVAGSNAATRTLMKKFAPMPRALGLHWHHFNQPILPPIVDLGGHIEAELIKNKVLIYLPFEDSQKLLGELKGLSGFEFYVYSPTLSDSDNGAIHTREPSRYGFKQDLASAERVVCNTGFELISEALQLGKTILTKPLTGQMEQHSNALALQQLGLASTVVALDKSVLQSWLTQPLSAVRVRYPDVAGAIAQWVVDGGRESIGALSKRLWGETVGFSD